MMTRNWRSVVISAALAMGGVSQGLATAEPSIPDAPVLVTVNGEPILQSTYETAVRVAGRQRFYHGKAPEAELIAFRKEVAARLVDERILHQEAVRSGIAPDQSWIDAEFAKIDRRYSSSPEWRESADSLKKQILDGLAQRSLIEQLDERLHNVEAPSEAEVHAYYAANPDKFTSPEQFRVSSILLSVEPWQPNEVWQEKEAEGRRILAEVTRPGKFDEYAKNYPPLEKAQLGYIHRGMLGETAQVEIDKLQEGEISDIVSLLEGIAIFRLDERVPATLNPFEKVSQRARELLLRDLREQRYQERIAALRNSAEVKYVNPQYLNVPNVATLRDGHHGGESTSTQK